MNSSNSRDRLLAASVAALFFQRVLDEAKAQHLISDEHFTVDGTLLEALTRTALPSSPTV